MNTAATTLSPATAVRRLWQRQLPVNPIVTAWRSTNGSLHASSNCPSLHTRDTIEIAFADWVEADEHGGQCACGSWTLLAAADTLRKASSGLAIHDAVQAGHAVTSWKELVDWLRLELDTLDINEHGGDLTALDKARIQAFKTETSLCATQLVQAARTSLTERPLQAAIAAQGITVPIRTGIASLFDKWGRQQLGEIVGNVDGQTSNHPALFENALDAALARKEKRFILIHEASCAADVNSSARTGALVAYTASRVWGSPLGQLHLAILPTAVADGLFAIVGRQRWITECAQLPSEEAAELAIQLWEPDSNSALATLDTALRTAESLS